ncbi:WIAG-tail domain, partial [Paenibacillus rhizophilus]
SYHLAPSSVGGGQLAESAVQSEHLAEGSVEGRHIAAGEITLEHLAEEVRSPELLPDGSIGGSKLAPKSIGSDLLTEGAVGGAELQDEAVDGSKIAPLSIQSRHLEEESVQSQHLAPSSVGGEHLMREAVSPEHLTFNPVRSAGNRSTLQQFGMSAFLFAAGSDSVDVTVTFDEPFGHTGYVMVAMTNQPFFYASLKSRGSADAILQVVRLRDTQHFYGVLSWIAIGAPAVKPAPEDRLFD